MKSKSPLLYIVPSYNSISPIGLCCRISGKSGWNRGGHSAGIIAPNNKTLAPCARLPWKVAKSTLTRINDHSYTGIKKRYIWVNTEKSKRLRASTRITPDGEWYKKPNPRRLLVNNKIKPTKPQQKRSTTKRRGGKRRRGLRRSLPAGFSGAPILIWL